MPALALTLLRALPVRPAVLLARLLLVSYLAVRPDYRAEIRANYRTIFGSDRPGFWVANAWQIGRNLVWMARISSPFAGLLIDRVEVSGENVISWFLEQNVQAVTGMSDMSPADCQGQVCCQRADGALLVNGLVMASFHHGLWEFLPALFRQYREVVLVVGAQRQVSLDSLVRRARLSQGVKLVQGAAELARKGWNGLAGFMLDNTSRGRMVSARSGRLRMKMPGSAFRLADMRTGKRLGGQFSVCGVMPLFCVFERGRLRVRVYPAGDESHALECLLTEVRRNPTDWVFWGKAGALEAS